MKKLKLRKEIKEILIGSLITSLIFVSIIGIIGMRLNQLCENGYTQYCSIEK